MKQIKRRSALRILVLLPLFLFITAYQLRSSIGTVYVYRNSDFFVPFSIEPFTSRVYGVTDRLESDNPLIRHKWMQSAPIELLAVNHRPFRGLSVYLTQLWRHQPFSLTIRYAGSAPFEASYGFGHCTCVVSTVWELTQVFVLPPLTCVLLAFLVLWKRPDSILLWALAALLLSASQISLYPRGFHPLTSPMAWTDGFRIPATAYRAFIQDIWPAALLIFVAHLLNHRSNVRRFSLWVAVPFISFALVRAIMAASWSENYVPFVPLYRYLDDHGTEFIAAGFGLAVVLCFVLNRVSNILVTLLSAAAISALYRFPPPVTGGAVVSSRNLMRLVNPARVDFTQEPTLFLPNIPDPFISSTFVVAFFAAMSFLFVCLCERRRVKPVLAFSLALLVPSTVFVLGLLGGAWTIWQRLAVINFFTISTGLGLIGLCCHCIRSETGKGAKNTKSVLCENFDSTPRH